jgi:hypothetical protein
VTKQHKLADSGGLHLVVLPSGQRYWRMNYRHPGKYKTLAFGVSAGLDFGIAIVASRRGKNYAQSLMLIAEYQPEPPFPGGTLATTLADIGGMITDMFLPREAKFRAIAKRG